jgi:poly(hydroxyalkanoate) granule-associated protein
LKLVKKISEISLFTLPFTQIHQEHNMASRLKKAAQAAKSAATPVEQITEKLGQVAASLSEQQMAKQVMDSAQQIWLAGLGAFSKAQDEGKKVFDTLVKQGEALETRTRHVAEATMETARDQASKTFEAATGKFDRLEQVFEARVHKSLNRLGVLTSKDVEALSAQVAELADAVRALMAQEKRTTARPAAKVATVAKAVKTVARKVVAKKPAAKKVARKQ